MGEPCDQPRENAVADPESARTSVAPGRSTRSISWTARSRPSSRRWWKAIGLGLAIAVAIDATLVRVLIVLAVMRILGDYKRWARARCAPCTAGSGLGEYGPSALEETAA